MATAKSDISQTLDFVSMQGDSFDIEIRVINEDGSPYDFTGCTAEDIWKRHNTSVLTFSTGSGLTLTSGKITYSKPAASMDIQTGIYTHGFRITLADGGVKTWFDGKVTHQPQGSNNAGSQSVPTITISESGDSVTLTVINVSGLVSADEGTADNDALFWNNTAKKFGKKTLSETKTILSINNVNNTSDLNKPVSTAQQSALDLKVDKVAGKGLSTNDYDNTEKSKLAATLTDAEFVTKYKDKDGGFASVNSNLHISATKLANQSDLNADRITQDNLSNELISQITGTTSINPVIADGSVIPTKTSFIPKVYSKNRFDKTVHFDGYVHESEGYIAEYAGSLVSDMISVVPGGVYYLSGRANMGTKGMRFLGEDKTTPIKPLETDGTERPTFTLAVYNGLVRVPATAYWVQFTVAFGGSGSLDGVQFEAGNSATSYSAYGYSNKVQGDILPGLYSKVNIKNSDKITVFGNSYTEGYTMKGKHYLSFLSMLSDYQFRNFAKSGDDMLEVMARIRTDEKRFGIVPVSEFGTTYGIIACRDNNSELYGVNIDTYYENAKKLAKEIEALGAKVILSTEHQGLYGQLFEAFARLKHEFGYMFMNWGKFAYNCFNNNYFPPLWYNDHPATRTQALWSENIRHYLNTLPRPQQGIKIFRKRSGVTVSDINTDLMFETLFERARLFEEIYVGHLKLTSATEKYFDRLQSSAYEAQNDEYLAIQAGTSVSLDDYALVECVIPYTSNSLNSFRLYLTATNLSKVYVKKTLGLSSYPAYPENSGSAYYNTFENPLGEWVELIQDPNGYYELPEGYFLQAVNYDKLSFLLAGDGSAVALSDVYFEATGSKLKDRDSGKVYEIRTGTELLSANLLNSGWDETGTPANYTPVVDPSDGVTAEVLPSGVTVVKEIDNTNYISQALNSIAAQYRDYNIQARILCRYFPEFVSDDTKWTTSVIKGDSFDLAQLMVQISCDGGANMKLAQHHVNLYWHEIVIDGILTNGAYNTLILKSADARKIQIAKVEVKVF